MAYMLVASYFSSAFTAGSRGTPLAGCRGSNAIAPGPCHLTALPSRCLTPRYGVVEVYVRGRDTPTPDLQFNPVLPWRGHLEIVAPSDGVGDHHGVEPLLHRVQPDFSDLR